MRTKKKVIKINMDKFLRVGLPAMAIFAFLIGAIVLKGVYSLLALICM